MSVSRYVGLAPAVVLLPAVCAPVSAAEPFTLIVVPDTQNYTDFASINDQYNLGQMRWIRDNMASRNIKFVMHLGDLQNPGNPYRARTDNIYEPDFSRPLGDVNEKQTKWDRADAAIRVLDNNGIPYSLVPGNHDYLDHNTKSEPWLYLKTFGPSRYTSNPKHDENGDLTYGGASPANPSNGYAGMNSYHRFAASGYKFLNIALQFNPDDHDLRWAQQIINENPGLPTIITTHAFVNTKPAANDYQHPHIFNKLIKNNPQIVMTVNGHLTGAHRVEGVNIAGHKVQQMLVDFQASQLDAQLGGDYYRGGGALRMLEFDPDNDRVNIRDYSPIANRYLPSSFTAPDNDGDIATYSTPTNFTLDLDGRFGLPHGQGVPGSVSFRQGVNGYTGTRDTYLDDSAPATNFGESTIAWVDRDRTPGTTGNQQAHGLIRFDFLSGDNAIPAGAIVKSAELLIHTSSLADSQSPNTMSLHRLLKGWQEPTATWDSQTGGISADAVDALLGATGSVVPDVVDEFLSFDVTESVWAWMAGAPNHGWALLPGGANGWRWDTSESGDILNRPMLNVDFTLAEPLIARWNSADGNWATGSNWLSGGVPAAAAHALIDFATPGATVHVSSNVADIFSLAVRNGNVLSIGPSGDVRNTGFTFDNPEYAFRIGDGSAGSVILNDGTLANISNWNTALQGADIYVGVGAGGNGTVTQDGALSRLQGRDIRIGSGAGATGVYHHNGGTTDADWLLAGRDGGTGTYNLNGGALNANQLHIAAGSGSVGAFNFQSGNANVAVDAYVGLEGGIGVATQHGGSLSVARNLIIGAGSGASGFADGRFDQAGGTVTVGGDLLIGLGGAAGRYNLSGGTLNAARVTNGGTFDYSGGAASIGALTGTGTTRIGSGVGLAADRIAQASVEIEGTLTVRPNGSATGVSRIDAITLGPSGRFDLADNKLITRMPAGTWNGSAYDGVAGMVEAGRGEATNALWNGTTGILTSDPRAIDTGNLVSIGVAKVGDVRNVGDAETTPFAGQIVQGSDTIAMVTWGGDATLDGTINIDDYGRIDSNVGLPGASGWANGDFNYDGTINIDDYGIIDSNITRQGTPFVTGGDVAMTEGVGAIPEPASALVVMSALARASLLRRRRV